MASRERCDHQDLLKSSATARRMDNMGNRSPPANLAYDGKAVPAVELYRKNPGIFPPEQRAMFEKILKASKNSLRELRQSKQKPRSITGGSRAQTQHGVSKNPLAAGYLASVAQIDTTCLGQDEQIMPSLPRRSRSNSLASSIPNVRYEEIDLEGELAADEMELADLASDSHFTEGLAAALQKKVELIYNNAINSLSFIPGSEQTTKQEIEMNETAKARASQIAVLSQEQKGLVAKLLAVQKKRLNLKRVEGDLIQQLLATSKDVLQMSNDLSLIHEAGTVMAAEATQISHCLRRSAKLNEETAHAKIRENVAYSALQSVVNFVSGFETSKMMIIDGEFAKDKNGNTLTTSFTIFLNDTQLHDNPERKLLSNSNTSSATKSMPISITHGKIILAERMTRAEGFLLFHRDTIASKRNVVCNADRKGEADAVAKSVTKIYETFDDDKALLCFLFIHKFQALCKVMYPDVDFTQHSKCHEYNADHTHNVVKSRFAANLHDHYVDKFMS